jgi:hypothetical protein
VPLTVPRDDPTIETNDATSMRARGRASWGLSGRIGPWWWRPTRHREAVARAGAFAEPRRGPAAAAKSERSRARRVAASTVANRQVRRRRSVAIALPRPSVDDRQYIARHTVLQSVACYRFIELAKHSITSFPIS